MENNLMSGAELASYLGLKETTLSVWRTRGEGPDFIKVGAKVMYRLSAVEEWLLTRTKNPREKNGNGRA